MPRVLGTAKSSMKAWVPFRVRCMTSVSSLCSTRPHLGCHTGRLSPVQKVVLAEAGQSHSRPAGGDSLSGDRRPRWLSHFSQAGLQAPSSRESRGRSTRPARRSRRLYAQLAGSASQLAGAPEKGPNVRMVVLCVFRKPHSCWEMSG